MFQDLFLALTGSRELFVENYKCLLDYNDCCIAIEGKKERLIIHGEHLLIETFSSEGMKIKGRIYSIEYREWNRKPGGVI